MQGKPPEAGSKPVFGSSPATQATPNAGYDAAAMQGMGVLITMAQNLLVKVGAQSEAGKVLLDVLTKLTKAVPAGTVPPAVQNSVLDQTKMANTQMGAMQQQLAQRARAAGAPGAPGAGGPPPGGPAPMGAAA